VLSFIDGRREILDRGSAVEISNQASIQPLQDGSPRGFIEASPICIETLRTPFTVPALGYGTRAKYSAELALEGMEFLKPWSPPLKPELAIGRRALKIPMSNEDIRKFIGLSCGEGNLPLDFVIQPTS